MLLKDKAYFGISTTSNFNPSAQNQLDNFYNSPNSDLMQEIEQKAASHQNFKPSDRIAFSQT